MQSQKMKEHEVKPRSEISLPEKTYGNIVATNGTYTALRAAVPHAFGAGAPEVAGDLEYYARVSAAFRFQ